jgi:Zn-dependent protease
MDLILNFTIIFFSLVLHEVSHGHAAKMLGDNTAEQYGRLSLNPLRHIDMMGTIIVPFVMIMIAKATNSQPIVFGWAKPVPVNPYNLKNPKRDMALVALAGPLSNILLASVIAIIVRFNGFFGFSSDVISWLIVVVYLNALWMVFNLVPIPPLDGSKILFYFIKNANLEATLNRFGFMILMMIIFYGFGPIQILAGMITKLLIGS